MEFRLMFSLSILILLVLVVSHVSATGGVFRVKHKFAGQELSLKAFKEHDIHRHGRLLAAIDLPLGGDGKSTGTGLYYTKIAIGSPPKDYFVHVDTGSDIFWVNCIQCKDCPKKSGLGVDLKLYDPQSSSTGQLVNCDAQFCSDMNKSPISDCPSSMVCPYALSYEDGSQTAGYFVKDFIELDGVSGNLQTTSINASVIFGCGVQQTRNLIQSNEALDGILGFGASSTSMLSQLTSFGIVKKKFAHCLDGVSGGGIFTIGSVVQSQVQTTPLIPNQSHYNVNMESVTVGKTTLRIPSSVFGSGAVIDSGTTLSYLPKAIYEPLINEITSSQPGLNVRIVQDFFSCFQFSRSVDDGFPAVTFQFADSLTLVVYPHDYLFKYRGEWCIGWQNSGKLSKEVDNRILLGDLVLSNKLVTYDLENHTIGWTEYNCSSTIKIQDESGSVYEKNEWCIGWQISGTLSKQLNGILLGNMVLSNKLVTYDLENHTIGWTEHNCSSNIKIQGDSGSVYEVGSHDLASQPFSPRPFSSDAQALYLGRVLMLLLLTVLIVNTHFNLWK